MTDYVAHVKITANLWHEELIKRDFFFSHQLYFSLKTSHKQSVGITKCFLIIDEGRVEANIFSEKTPEVFLSMMTFG